MTVTIGEQAVGGADVPRAMGHWAAGIAVVPFAAVADDVPHLGCRRWQRVDAGDRVILTGQAVGPWCPGSVLPLTDHEYWAK